MNHKEEYWNGNINRLIRYYFYVMRGLALFNEARYLIMAIFGIYVILKLSNPIWLVIMFFISIPILCAFGWLSVHKLSKVMDWLNIEFSTHWGRYGYELQEKQIALLEQIKEMLKEK